MRWAAVMAMWVLGGCSLLFSADPVDIDPDSGQALFFDWCSQLGTPGEAVSLDPMTAFQFDTDIGELGGQPQTTVPIDLDNTPMTVWWVEEFSVPDTSVIFFGGQSPAIVAARGSLRIDGVVEVSSRRGGVIGAGVDISVSGCGRVDVPGGAAGGRGGAFGGDGGAGGINGGTTTTSPGLTEVAVLRAGCGGQPGGFSEHPPAAPGGAVVLVSCTSIEITGRVIASGAGGEGGDPSTGQVAAGGGGGGSGGLIALDAPVIGIPGAQILAWGGGGGGGGTASAPGVAGSDGTINNNPDPDGPGAGGEKRDSQSGAGGSGGDRVDGTDGGALGTLGGGGGGGGGAGIIYINGELSPENGTISPPPTEIPKAALVTTDQP